VSVLPLTYSPPRAHTLEPVDNRCNSLRALRNPLHVLGLSRATRLPEAPGFRSSANPPRPLPFTIPSGTAFRRARPLDAERDLGQLRSPMVEVKIARTLQVVARGLGRLGRERARSAADITPQQAEALQLISDRGVISTSALALMLGIDPSTASRNLAGLERGGLIVRRRGTEDGRQTDVRLTSRGKRIAEAVTTEWSTACSTLLDRVPRAERQRVAEVLDVLARVLESS
jgi:DNA-binding MarR family transcriptional regulator